MALCVVLLVTRHSAADLRIGLALVLPVGFTVYAWVRDRRLSRRGHCSCCAFNLTGNVSGRCPGFGKRI